MNIHIWQFLVICPLVFLAGFIDAIAGGGGLISLPAYMIAGFPVHFAIGTNKLSSGMGSLLATWRYARKGYISWKRSIICVFFALAGSSIGANIALLIDDGIFKMIMLIVIPLTALYVFRKKSLTDIEREAYSEIRTTLISLLAAFGIGIYDGFYGPGTGTFLILLLTGAAHMKLSQANGTAKVINLTTNITALAVYFMNGKTIVILGLIAGLFSILGNNFGTKCFDRGGVKVVKPVMVTVLVIFFVKILLEVL